MTTALCASTPRVDCPVRWTILPASMKIDPRHLRRMGEQSESHVLRRGRTAMGLARAHPSYRWSESQIHRGPAGTKALCSHRVRCCQGRIAARKGTQEVRNRRCTPISQNERVQNHGGRSGPPHIQPFFLSARICGSIHFLFAPPAPRRSRSVWRKSTPNAIRAPRFQ